MARSVQCDHDSVGSHRRKLIRRVRTAYSKMEYWEFRHKLAVEELGVFMLRFPRRTSEETASILTQMHLPSVQSGQESNSHSG